MWPRLPAHPAQAVQVQTRASIQLFICARCVHKQDSFHRKDPEAQLRLGCTLCPLGSGSILNWGDSAISGTALGTTQVSATKEGGGLQGGRPEDLQWVKPHCPHPGACHPPQAGIASGVPPVQSGPPEPLEGRQGPIWGQEAGETCTGTSGKTERQHEAGPCPSWAQPSPSAPAFRWTASRAHTRRALRVGWRGRVSAQGVAALTLTGDSTSAARLPGTPRPAGPHQAGRWASPASQAPTVQPPARVKVSQRAFPEIPVKRHSAVQPPVMPSEEVVKLRGRSRSISPDLRLGLLMRGGSGGHKRPRVVVTGADPTRGQGCLTSRWPGAGRTLGLEVGRGPPSEPDL